MKKLLLLFITLVILSSCSPEEGNTIPFHIEFLSVDTVEVPQSITPGYDYAMTITYRRPTDCHYFQGFYYEQQGDVHIIAPQTMVLETEGCQPLDNAAPEVETFTFQCDENYEYDHYIFKFYTGEDQIGNQSFYSIEVPVVN